VRESVEALNAGDTQRLLAVVAPDIVIHYAEMPEPTQAPWRPQRPPDPLQDRFAVRGRRSSRASLRPRAGAPVCSSDNKRGLAPVEIRPQDLSAVRIPNGADGRA